MAARRPEFQLLARSGAPRLARFACIAAVLAAAPPGMGQTTSPYTIVQETEVRIELRLILQGPAGVRDATPLRLVGVAGKPLVFCETLESGGLEVATRGTLTAAPRADGTGVDVTVEAESSLAGQSRSRVERKLDLSAGRVGLVDLWNGGPEESTRLIAAMSVTWDEVPRVVPISPGRQPIDLVIEMLVEREGTRRTVERHRLGSLVGRPVGYTFASVPQSAKTPNAELVVEVTPLVMKQKTLDLSVRVRHSGDSAYSELASLDVTVGESLRPGQSVLVPLPRSDGAEPIVVKVTAYF